MNTLAFDIVRRATEPEATDASSPAPEKNAAAAELGRKGGNRRAERLTAKQREEAATRAAAARWKKSDRD